MKKVLYILLTTLFVACSSDNEMSELAVSDKLEISKNDVKIANNDGSFTINVTATGDWNAEVESTASQWLSLSKSGGTGNGDLRLFFEANTENDIRTGKIKVTMQVSGNVIQQEITVEQLGTDPNILIDYSNDVVPFTGTILACQVVSNIAWTVVIEDDDNWIEIVEPVVTRRFITEDLFLKIASNIGAERTGKAIVTTVGESVLS